MRENMREVESITHLLKAIDKRLLLPLPYETVKRLVIRVSLTDISPLTIPVSMRI